MNFVGKMMITACLMTGVSGQAMAQGAAAPTGSGPYVNADGSRTNDLEAAAATWRALSEFQGDHAKQQIGAEYAYARGITGKTMKVGVYDEGVEPKHPSFTSPGKVVYIDVTDKILENTRPRAGELLFNGTPIYRIAGNADHGVHVAGTIAAPRDGEDMMGVAPDAQIISGTAYFGDQLLRLERSYAGVAAVDPTNRTMAAIAESGVRIINNSWGSKLTEVVKRRDGLTLETVFDLQALVPGDANYERVVAAMSANKSSVAELGLPLVKLGIVSVFAAGNDAGAHASIQPSTPLVVPELESHWLSVANLDKTALALNKGSSVCGQTKAWCISAPGTDINSAAMSRTMTPETAAKASKLTPYESRAAYIDAVVKFRQSLAPDWWSFKQRNALNAYAAQIFARWQHPDPEQLGKDWAKQLFDMALKYQNAPNLLEAKATGLLDDMDIFHAIKQRFSNILKEDGFNIDARAVYDIFALRHVAQGYGWEKSPLYHMEMEYTRLATEATVLKLTEGLKSGTSMAAPHVAGGLALVMERFPYMSSDVARDTLLTTATDLGDPGVDGVFGWGRLNIGKAMTGPGAFLRDVDITLADGVRDSWDNDIADGSEYLAPRLVPKPKGDGKTSKTPENAPQDAQGKLGSGPVERIEEAYTGGLTLRGAGVLALGGNNSYHGDTQVLGGTLLVNGALRNSAAFARDGGTIGGTGTLKSLLVDTGGTVSPGNSPGTLTVSGDLVFKQGSTFLVESAVNAAQIDRIIVGGLATIEGGTVRLQADRGNWNIRTRADILNADGGIAGRFEKIENNLGFLDALLAYGQKALTLTLRRNDVTFASVGATPNQRAAGRGLNGLAMRGALYDALVDGSVAAVSRALDSFSGEAHASLAAVAWNDTAFVRDAMLRRMPHSSMAVSAGVVENQTPSGVVAWGQAIAGFAERDASVGLATVKTNSKGFVTGIDKSWDDRFNLGVAFGHLDTDANIFRAGSSNSKVRSWHAGGYVGAEFGAARVRAGGSWGWYKNRTARVASVNAFSDSLSASYGGRAWQAFGEFGLGIEAGSLSFEPFANLTHADYRSKPIAERGGLARLAGRASQKATMATLGLRSAAKLLESAEGRSGYGRVNIGWRHGFDKDGAIADLSIAESANRFRAIGADAGRDLAVIDLALDLPVTQSLDIGVTYGGQFSSVYAAHAAKATLQLRF